MELLIVLALIGWTIWYFAFRRKVDAPNKTDAVANRHDSDLTSDLSMLPERFVVFDVETTGLYPEQHEIIELAAVRVNRDSSEHETFSTLVQPRGRISARITQLTGLDRKMLKAEGLEITKVLQEFRDFVGDLPLVAFNASFDRGFLHSECDRANLPRFGNRWDCALAVARKAWPDRDSYKLSAICKDAGIALDSEHRALSDSQRAMLVYVAGVQKLGHCSIRD